MSDFPNGKFKIKGPKGVLNVVSSDGMGWEHVSVSVRHSPHKIPSWKEISFIKGFFWGDEVWVMQFHPPKSEYVNNHPGVLHLWSPLDIEFPVPLSILVEYKELGNLLK